MRTLVGGIAIIGLIIVLFGTHWMNNVMPRMFVPQFQIPPPQIDIPQVPPLLPPINIKPRPSSAFLAGYSDGYYKTWLDPFRWSFNSEYRNGWSEGEYDRKHGVPHRYSGDFRQ